MLRALGSFFYPATRPGHAPERAKQAPKLFKTFLPYEPYPYYAIAAGIYATNEFSGLTYTACHVHSLTSCIMCASRTSVSDYMLAYPAAC